MRKIQSIKNIDLTSFAHLSIPKKKQRELEKDSPFKLNLKLKTLQFSNVSNHSNLRTQNNQSKSRQKQPTSTEYNTERNYGVNEFNLSSKDALALLYQKQKSVNLFNMKSYIRLKPSRNPSIHAQDLIDIPNQQTIIYNSMIYKFDKVFLSEATQSSLYEEVGEDLIMKFMEGHNGTVFAYGNTGSGKTYTMFGEGDGIVPRAVETIFQKIKKEKISCSMLEIYKQNLIDLLSPTTQHPELKIKQANSVVSIQNLSIIELKSKDQTLQLIRKGNNLKRIRETSLNQSSSRSHIIFSLYLEKVDEQTKSIINCKLNLVDLAGSEKVSKSKVEGEGLEEAKKINLSLSCLGNTISALVKGSEHIPYRQSKLTRILRESLMGNSINRLIVTCAIDEQTIQQTISSFKFAQRARRVKTQAEITLNVKKYDDEKKISIKRLSNKILELEQRLSLAMKIIKENEGVCSCCEKYQNLLQKNQNILNQEIKIEDIINEDEQMKKYKTNEPQLKRDFSSNSHQRPKTKSKKKLVTNVTNNTNFTNITNITNIQKSKERKSAHKCQKLKEQNELLHQKITRLESKIKYFQDKFYPNNHYDQKENHFNQVNIQLPQKRIIRVVNHATGDVRSPKNHLSKIKNHQNQYFSNKNMQNVEVKEQKQTSQKQLNLEYQLITEALSKLQSVSLEFKTLLNPLQRQILLEQIDFLQNLVIGQENNQNMISNHLKYEKVIRKTTETLHKIIEDLLMLIIEYGEKGSQENRLKLKQIVKVKKEVLSSIKNKTLKIDLDESFLAERKSLQPFNQQKRALLRQPDQVSLTSQNQFLQYFIEETLSCNEEIPQENPIKITVSKNKK